MNKEDEKNNKKEEIAKDAQVEAVDQANSNKGPKKEGITGKQEKSDKSRANKAAAQIAAKSVYGEKRSAKRKFGNKRQEGKQDEIQQSIVDLARVTRVMAGGKRMRFRACVAIGDKKGKVAIGIAKGADVAIAVQKAVQKARKKFITAPIVNGTIPHEIYCKKGAAKILLKPASKGRGVIAGGAVRIVLELAGIHNITSKILGTNNKINNVACAIEALGRLRKVEKKKNKKKEKENKGEKKREDENNS